MVSQVAPAITSANRQVVDGWIEVCDSAILGKEDVIRFDHAKRTYAIYRLADAAGSTGAAASACPRSTH